MAFFLPSDSGPKSAAGHPYPSHGRFRPERSAFHLLRHARTRSTAVRFRWAGPGARLWYRRVTGPSAQSRLGLLDARTARPRPPLSPRTCSGVQTVRHRSRPVSPGTASGAGRGPGQAWTPEQVRGDKRRPEMVLPVGVEPVSKLNMTAMDSFRASTSFPRSVRSGKLVDGREAAALPGSGGGLTEEYRSTLIYQGEGIRWMVPPTLGRGGQ